ncbi:hypothetical protein CRG98_008645 [Punica granatum]|uniref:Uncharacterized protein n=1 Tax=Punica granatum TaxID=22663 RepID=A0A2I0KR80_PUNGR|nr:hypothetical protein CRG98_008645 [Punica granatum]
MCRRGARICWKYARGSRRWWSMRRGRLRMCRGRWIDFLEDIDTVFFHHPDTLTSWVSETTPDPRGVKEHLALFRRIRPRGLLDPPWVTGGIPRRFGPFFACIIRQAR